MSIERILLILVGGGLLVATLYMFIRIIFSPSSSQTKAEAKPPAENRSEKSKGARA